VRRARRRDPQALWPLYSLAVLTYGKDWLTQRVEGDLLGVVEVLAQMMLLHSQPLRLASS
jgi:hypothetical protein